MSRGMSVAIRLAAPALLAGMFAGNALASPLCAKAQGKVNRDQCECSSQTGGRITEDPATKRVSWQIPQAKQFPIYADCMRKRGNSGF